MPTKIELRLFEPLVDHDRTISVIMVREPKAGDVMDLGDPVVLARAENGAMISVENDAKVAAYIARLVRDENGKQISPNIFAQASLADFLRVKDAVLGFFTTAHLKALNRESASSSSDTDASMPSQPAI